MSLTIQTRLDEQGQNSTTTPGVTIGDDGRPEQCTCVWPDEVHRVDVVIGINEAGQKRRRVIDQCQDCGGEVR